MNPKPLEISLKISKKQADRVATYIIYHKESPIIFSVHFNKSSSYLQIQIEGEPIDKKQLNIAVYRNLDNSHFCKTFFALKNMKNTVANYKIDYCGKFLGVNPQYEKNIHQIMYDKLVLQPKNYLITAGWKISSVINDFSFYFIQRRCYEYNKKTDIIRTAGIQFYTEKGLNILTGYQND